MNGPGVACQTTTKHSVPMRLRALDVTQQCRRF